MDLLARSYHCFQYLGGATREFLHQSQPSEAKISLPGSRFRSSCCRGNHLFFNNNTCAWPGGGLEQAQKQPLFHGSCGAKNHLIVHWSLKHNDDPWLKHIEAHPKKNRRSKNDKSLNRRGLKTVVRWPTGFIERTIDKQKTLRSQNSEESTVDWSIDMEVWTCVSCRRLQKSLAPAASISLYSLIQGPNANIHRS